jgi:flagellar biosynthesis protein FliR
LDLSFLLTDTILVFLLMLIRITGMLVSAPMFSQSAIPMQVQVGVAIALSVVLFPVYAAQAVMPAKDLWQFSIIAGQEFIIGALLGFVATLVFTAVQMAGNHLSTQMSLAISQVLDPSTQQQTPILGQFYFIMAILLFLSLNIHHGLIVALGASFDAIPVAGEFIGAGLLSGRITQLGSAMFSLSIMLIMPVLGIMLVKEIAMAFMAKIMPQMNIFMVAIPLKIVVGMLLVYTTLPFTMDVLGNAFHDLVKHLIILFQS